MNESVAALAEAAGAASFSPLNTALLTVAIGLLGLIFKHQIDSRRVQIDSRRVKIDEGDADIRGFEAVVKTLQSQVDRMEVQLDRANDRIQTLEEEKAADHRLILELLSQLNRTQAAAIMASNNLSPQLRRAMESLRDSE